MVDIDFLVNEKLEIKKNVNIPDEQILNKVKKDFTDSELIVVAIPAFLNAHVHSGDYSLIGEAYGKNTSELVGSKGIKTLWLKNASIEQVKKNIRAFSKTNIKNGVGTIIDFREGGIKGAKAAREALQDIDINYLLLGRTDNPDEISELAEFVDGIGIPDAVRWPRKTIEEIVEEAKNHQLLTGMHVAETENVRKKFIEIEGETDVEFALDLGIDFLVHLTKANDWDLREVKRSQSIAIFSPRANMLLENNFPPIERFIRENTPFLLGTDNSFITDPDFFKELDFIARSIREKEKQALSSLFRAAVNLELLERKIAKNNLKRTLTHKYVLLPAPEFIEETSLVEWIVLHSHI